MKVVAFRAKRPMNYEVFRPLHRRLLQRRGVRIVLYGKEQGGSSTALFDKVGALPARRRPNWLAKWSAPDVLVSADWLLPTRRAATTVQIFHGISGKGHNMNARIRDYDHVFLIGPWLERRLVQRGLVEAGDPRLHKVGMPKTDRLTDGSLDRQQTLRGLGLDPDLPTVLYAPSWGEESSLEKMGEDVLKALANLDANVIVKPHDNSLDPRFARRDWRSVLDELAGPRFAAPHVWDVIPLMHAADLLVSDLSSVGFEWLHLDRPSIFVTFDGQLDRWDDRADIETWRSKIGAECSDPRALPELVRDELAHPDRHAAVRREALHDVHYNPGRATDAAMEHLDRLLGQPASPDPTLAESTS